MGKVISYMNAAELGIFCQIELESKERIFISMGRDEESPDSPCGVKIFEMDSEGVYPIEKIWGSCDFLRLQLYFGIQEDGTPCEKYFLDCIRDRLINCSSIKEVKAKLGISWVQ